MVNSHAYVSWCCRWRQSGLFPNTILVPLSHYPCGGCKIGRHSHKWCGLLATRNSVACFSIVCKSIVSDQLSSLHRSVYGYEHHYCDTLEFQSVIYDFCDLRVFWQLLANFQSCRNHYGKFGSQTNITISFSTRLVTMLFYEATKSNCCGTKAFTFFSSVITN